MIPKISDFGMARLIGQYETGDKTRTIVGTVYVLKTQPKFIILLKTLLFEFSFWLPQRLHVSGIHDGRDILDVFSFGVLLLEILSGKRHQSSHLSKLILLGLIIFFFFLGLAIHNQEELDILRYGGTGKKEAC